MANRWRQNARDLNVATAHVPRTASSAASRRQGRPESRERLGSSPSTTGQAAARAKRGLPPSLARAGANPPVGRAPRDSLYSPPSAHHSASPAPTAPRQAKRSFVVRLAACRRATPPRGRRIAGNTRRVTYRSKNSAASAAQLQQATGHDARATRTVSTGRSRTAQSSRTHRHRCGRPQIFARGLEPERPASQNAGRFSARRLKPAWSLRVARLPPIPRRVQ